MSLTGKAGDAASTWRGPVTLKPAFADATSGVAGRSVSLDGKPAKALTASTVVVERDGSHTVTFAATDAAGNRATTTRAFRIDTVAPTVTPRRSPATRFAAADRDPERRRRDGHGLDPVLGLRGRRRVRGGHRARRQRGPQPGPRGRRQGRPRLGRTDREGQGRPRRSVHDRDHGAGRGRQRRRQPAKVTVDVYAALAGLARSPALFFPQDGDRLARSATVGFRLLARAKVTIRVVDAAGAVVRTAYVDRTTRRGDVAWSWNGKVAGGAYARPGDYRIVVSATNGQQHATGSATVRADAFRLSTSTTDATRGRRLTVTARSAEPLAAPPVLVVREPGVAAWTVAMTHGPGASWTATVTPKRAGAAGTLSLTVKARDAEGGRNASILRLTLR